MVERVARAIDPLAFDETHFSANADYYTKPGDFERGQERARQRARAAIAAMQPFIDKQIADAVEAAEERILDYAKWDNS